MTGFKTRPDDYLNSRPTEYDGERIISQYVAVRDGTRLAVDIHLPGTAAKTPEKFPAVCVFTPYYRRFALGPGAPADLDAAPTVAFYRDMFVPRGYALITVDVRGSGASFGARDGFRSPRERLDHHDIADWVSRQPWCSGAIGATGISYPGAASDFLASTLHPSVKAVAPISAVWDTWSNHLYPGGVLCNCIIKNYGALTEALDQDDRDAIPRGAYFYHPERCGPAPVDEDPDGKLLKQALKDHAGNFDMQDFAQQMRFRDQPLSDHPDYTSALISPYHYATRRQDTHTAYLTLSGWMDGHYQVGTVQRFKWLTNPASRMILGPWDHGARAQASPWRGTAPEDRNAAQQPFVAAAVLRFFDEHLMGRKTGLKDEARVHYYTMAAEAWQASDAWPPRDAADMTLHFRADGALATDPPTDDEAADAYQGDYDCRTGKHTRYDRLYLGLIDTYYDDWDGRDRAMLTYTSDPLDHDMEVTGHPSVDLHFTSTEKDCAFFVYLEDVVPADGGTPERAVYVTEGVFRALHRRGAAHLANIPSTGPGHSFNMADARHLTPGRVHEAEFQLAPTSYLFRAGHRIRIAIALADSDHFSRIPDGRPPRITVLRQQGRESRLILPAIPR
ncbi:MAG: CocE/NonD family hydrolase [Rhodospirillaceae bacterium]